MRREGGGGGTGIQLLATPLVFFSKRVVPRNLAPDFFVYGGAFWGLTPCLPPVFVWEVKGQGNWLRMDWCGSKGLLSFLIWCDFFGGSVGGQGCHWRHEVVFDPLIFVREVWCREIWLQMDSCGSAGRLLVWKRKLIWLRWRWHCRCLKRKGVAHGWVMPHMHESRHVWISHVMYAWVTSRMNESRHIWMSRVTYEGVMSHLNESCYVRTNHVKYECVMSHMNESGHI